MNALQSGARPHISQSPEIIYTRPEIRDFMSTAGPEIDQTVTGLCVSFEYPFLKHIIDLRHNFMFSCMVYGHGNVFYTVYSSSFKTLY